MILHTISRRRLATVVAMTATAAVAACSGGGSGGGDRAADLDYGSVADYAPTDREDIRDGGELTLALAELSEQQNYFQADRTAYTGGVWHKYNPHLTRLTPEGEYNFNEDYLTDVSEETEDGKTVVTYTINDKASYNDGTPIDWRAFKHTWEYNNGEKEGVVPAYTDAFELIESVTRGENDKQAVVTYKQAYPWWEGNFSTLLPPQVDTPEKYQEAYLNRLHPEWGAGPFTIGDVDFKKGTVSFVPNDKWWGEKPKLDRITYRVMEDQASLNAFRSGEIDATGVGTASRLKVVQDMGDQAEIRVGRAAALNLITLNSKSPVLSDPKVREAVFTAIDRSQLAEIRFQGLGFEEHAPGSFFLYDVEEGYEDNFSAVVQHDPDKARTLLEEAGWKEGPDGIREKDGERLSFRYTNFGDDPTFKALAQATQAMLKDVGIDLRIDTRPGSDFSKVTSEYDFDLLPMAFSSSGPEGTSSFLQIYGSDSQLNRSRTGNPEFDAQIREMLTLPTKEEQIERANELEKEAFGHFGIMPTMTRPAITAVKPGLVNFGPTFFGDIPIEDVGWLKE